MCRDLTAGPHVFYNGVYTLSSCTFVLSEGLRAVCTRQRGHLASVHCWAEMRWRRWKEARWAANGPHVACVWGERRFEILVRVVDNARRTHVWTERCGEGCYDTYRSVLYRVLRASPWPLLGPCGLRV